MLSSADKGLRRRPAISQRLMSDGANIQRGYTRGRSRRSGCRIINVRCAWHLHIFLSVCLYVSFSPPLSRWLSSMLTASAISISQSVSLSLLASSAPHPSTFSLGRRFIKMLSLLFLHQQLQTPISHGSDSISSIGLRNCGNTIQPSPSRKDFLGSTRPSWRRVGILRLDRIDQIEFDHRSPHRLSDFILEVSQSGVD